MKVLLRADVNSPCGSSSMARAFVKGFHNRVELKVENRTKMEVNVGIEVVLANLLQELCSVEMNDPDVVIDMDVPNNWSPKVKGAKHIGWLRWNATLIHSEWVRVMNSMDEIWTTTTSAAEAFKECGVTVPIVVMQAPVDSIFGNTLGELPLTDVTYTSDGATHALPIEKKDRRIIIGMVAHWNQSKCIDEFLIAAITQLDPSKYIIVLKTWINNIVVSEDAKILEKIHHIRNHVKTMGPPITVINRMMTDETIAQLYNSFDIYVSMGRCDATSMSALQAMASGVHVVSTGWGDPDYLSHAGATKVASHPVPSCGMGDAYLANGYWGQFDFRSFKEKMQKVQDLVENKEQLDESRTASKEHINRLHSGEAVGEAVFSRLEELLQSESTSEDV